jgi:hypothetical protein
LLCPQVGQFSTDFLAQLLLPLRESLNAGHDVIAFATECSEKPGEQEFRPLLPFRLRSDNKFGSFFSPTSSIEGPVQKAATESLGTTIWGQGQSG